MHTNPWESHSVCTCVNYHNVIVDGVIDRESSKERCDKAIGGHVGIIGSE